MGIPALESQAACRSGCDLPSGIPLTYAIAVAAVNGNSFEKNFSEEEIQRLTNYVLPKMVIGGPGNLYACGGTVILASAFSISGIREFSGANLIPAI